MGNSRLNRLNLVVTWACLVTMSKPMEEPDNDLKDYRITRMPTNPGLYYERGSGVEFARADWRVALFIDTKKISKN